MNWDKIKFFHYVAQEKNISHASKILNVTHATLSRQLKELEDELGKALFVRHQKGVALTEFGKNLYEFSKSIVNKFYEIENGGLFSNSHPSGHLRVVSDFGFVDTWLKNRLHEYISQNPDVFLDVTARQSMVNTPLHEFDIAITTQIFNEPGMIVIPYKIWHRKLYASEGYIRRKGIPKSLSDLDKSDLIAFGDKFTFPDENMDWHLSIGREGTIRKPKATINSMRGLINLATNDVGIISFSSESELLKGTNLREVLPDIYGPKVSSFIVTMNSLAESPVIKSFIEFLLRYK